LYWCRILMFFTSEIKKKHYAYIYDIQILYITRMAVFYAIYCNLILST